jgi:hypothetical protein
MVAFGSSDTEEQSQSTQLIASLQQGGGGGGGSSPNYSKDFNCIYSRGLLYSCQKIVILVQHTITLNSVRPITVTNIGTRIIKFCIIYLRYCFHLCIFNV